MLSLINKEGKCWSAGKAWQWYKSKPLIIGVNYVPRTAVNTTEMWQHETFDEKTIDQELGWAHDRGYNSVRVFLQYLVFQYEGERFLETFERFLQIAHSHEISVVPILFDDCAFSNLEPYMGKQNEPVYLVHNSGWTPSPGATYSEDASKFPGLESYVKTVIGAHADDDRILMWDIYNESGNSRRGAKSLYLLEKAFEWARTTDCSQPLTACYWATVNGATVNDCVFNDLKALELSDVITYHQYSNSENFHKLYARLESLGYPIICTEWLARVFFDSRVETILPLFEKYRIGSYHWGLVNGKIQTHIPWNWDKSKGEPEVWFHDVLNADGTAYSEEEMLLVKQVAERNK